MITISYALWVIIFSIAIALILLRLYFKRNGVISYPKALNSNFVLLFVLILVIMPNIFYNLSSHGLFPDPDCYLYIKDSNLISNTGHIQFSNLTEDPFYSSFPIFTLIVNSLSQVSGISSTTALSLLGAIIQLFFWLSVWGLFTKLFPQNSALPFSIIIVAFANVYLYGFLGIPMPQLMGLSILNLMILIALEFHNVEETIIFVLFSIFALVHVGVIPIFCIILCIELVIRRLFWAKLTSPVRSLVALLIPLIIFIAYISLTPAMYSFLNYLTQITRFFSALPGATAASVNSGLSRSFTPLNALAPAFIIGSNLALLGWFALKQHKKDKFNSLLIALSSTSILTVSIGTLRERFDVIDGFASISRYFALPGYALGTIAALMALNMIILPVFFRKSSKKFLLILQVILLILLLSIIFGGFLDPLSFRPLVPPPL